MPTWLSRGLPCWLLLAGAACAANEPQAANAPPAAAYEGSGAPREQGGEEGVQPLRTPEEEARRTFSRAQTKEGRARCELLREVVLLDPNSVDAHRDLALRPCAPANTRLENAAVFVQRQPSPESRTLQLELAMRAGRKEIATEAAAALIAMADTPEPVALGARALSELGRHEDAASAFEKLASLRTNAGASIDALEARLDAAAEAARSTGGEARARQLLGSTLEEALARGARYGAAWALPKWFEGVAALRRAGDAQGAAELRKKAQGRVGSSPPQSKLWLRESALESAARGDRAPLAKLVLASRSDDWVHDPTARALFAVDARLRGRCSEAKAHAQANAALVDAPPPRLEGDAQWGGQCEAQGGDSPPLSTLVPMRPSPAIDDLIELSSVDSLRARAALDQRIESNPFDVAARVARLRLSTPDERGRVVEQTLRGAPPDPHLYLAAIDISEEPTRGRLAVALAEWVLPGTVEVAFAPHLAAPFLARSLPSTSTPGYQPVVDKLRGLCPRGTQQRSCQTPQVASALAGFEGAK